MGYLSFANVCILLLIPLLVGRMHFLDQERWRSVGAGFAISYVFLDILPHLSSKQEALQKTVGTGIGAYIEHHAYLLALAGLVTYLSMAVIARNYRINQAVAVAQYKPHNLVYIIVLGLSAYNFMIGYMIGEQPEHRYEPVIIFTLAMALHMAGVDHTVREHYPSSYDKLFRYLLAAATFGGWLVGFVTTVPDTTFALAFSFLAGAVIIVAFVFELPVVLGGQRYWLFVAGVTGFSALLLIYEWLAQVRLTA